VRSPSTSWENNNDGSRPASLNVQKHLLPKQTIQSVKPPQTAKPTQSVMPEVSSVSLNTAHYKNDQVDMPSGSVQSLQEHPIAQSLSRQSSDNSIDFGQLHPNAVVVQGGEIVYEASHGQESQNYETGIRQNSSELPKTVKAKKKVKIIKKVLKKKSSGEEKAQKPELVQEPTEEPLKLKTKRVKSSSNPVTSPRSDVSPSHEVSPAQQFSPEVCPTILSHTSMNQVDQLQKFPETIIPDSPTNRIVQVIEVEETTITKRRKKKGTVLVKKLKRKEKPHKEKHNNLPEEHHEMADAYAQQEIKNMPNNVGLIEREETIIFDENELSQNKHNHKLAKSSKKQHKLIELIGEDAAKTVLDEQKLNVDQKLPREKSSSSEKSNSPKKKLHKTSSASSSGEFPQASTPTASSSYQNIHSPSVNSSSNHKKSLSKSHSSPHPSSQSRKYHPTAGTELPSDLSRESTEIAQEPQKLEKKSKKDKKSKKSSSKKTPDDEDLYRRKSNDSSSGVSTMNESGVVSTPERKGSAEGMSKIIEGDSALNGVNAILKKEKRKKEKRDKTKA